MILFKQHYKSSLGTGTNYVNLLPRQLTLDRSFIARRFREDVNTLFDEVKIVPARDIITPTVRRALKATPTREETKDDLLFQVRNRLKQIIYDHWNPEMYHVILHSSGIDSRVLSWLIRELYQEYGADWLGDYCFLCSKWEGASFKAIMQYEGWANYSVVNEESKNDEYYADSLLDFENAWQWSDGASAIPVNLFWYPIRQVKTDKPIQLFTGQWGNTIFDAGSGDDAGEGIRKAYKMFYWSVLCQRPMYGDEIIHPYTDEYLAYLIASSKVRLGKQLRFELVRFLDETLASFVNLMSDGDRHRKIADWIIKRMIDDYDQSWYGKSIKARPRHKTTEFQDFWSCWTSASLYEYLLRNGYTIQ